MKFTNKCFLVMGATSDIGTAICKMLAAEGATLFVTSRDSEKLNALVAQLPCNAIKHKTLVASIDESSYENMKTVFSEFVKQNNFDGVSGAVYCPGIAQILPLKAFSWDTINETMTINYTGAMMMLKMLARKEFRATQGGSIVLISSIRTRRGIKSLAIYGASKAALAASCKCAALELAPYKIRVNCVCPGSILTKMTLQTAAMATNHLQEMEDTHPLGIGHPMDVANAVEFLLSDNGKWITGTELVVDGGFLAG